MRAMGRMRAIGLGLALGALAMLLCTATASAGTIKGRVTDEAGNPIAGITVCADAPDFTWTGGCSSWTDADGRYAIEGLASGGYHVGFYVDGNPALNYAPQWYSDKAHPEEAAPITPTGGLIEGIDAVMAPGGQIAGTVTDRATRLPLAGVEVCPDLLGYFQSGEIGYCDRTDANGEYDVKNLRTGSYRVEFRTENGPNYIRENYAAEVPVTEGQVTAGIDAGLRAGLQIEGDLTDAATGLPAQSLLAPDYSGLSICALEPGTETRVACTWLEGDGHYELPGLPPGEYVIAFALDRVEEGVDFPDGFVRRFWDEVPTFGEATPVGSLTPTVISGIDATVSRGEEPLAPGVRLPGEYGAPPLSSPQVGSTGPVAAPPGAVRPTANSVSGPRRCHKTFRRVKKDRHARCVKIPGTKYRTGRGKVRYAAGSHRR
jgi:Carboxypeptidase regulatory-like domain